MSWSFTWLSVKKHCSNNQEECGQLRTEKSDVNQNIQLFNVHEQLVYKKLGYDKQALYMAMSALGEP